MLVHEGFEGVDRERLGGAFSGGSLEAEVATSHQQDAAELEAFEST